VLVVVENVLFGVTLVWAVEVGIVEVMEAMV
jgi:hypothetical protein